MKQIVIIKDLHDRPIKIVEVVSVNEVQLKELIAKAVKNQKEDFEREEQLRESFNEIIKDLNKQLESMAHEIKILKGEE